MILFANVSDFAPDCSDIPNDRAEILSVPAKLIAKK